MANRAETLRRVQALIAKAEGTKFEGEREAFLAKADELMIKYTIEEWEVDQARPSTQSKPEKRVIPVGPDSHLAIRSMMRIFNDVAVHTHCRAVFDYWGKIGAEVNAIVFGYASDLDYCELLWTSIKLQLLRDLEPKPDPDTPYLENLANLKESGMKWERIFALLQQIGQAPEGPWNRNIGVKYTKDYTKFCAEQDRPRLYVQPSVYVVNFAKGFEAEISDRLYAVQRIRKGHVAGKELVLRDRKENVDAALRMEFPQTRSLGQEYNKRFNSQAREAGRKSAMEADIFAGRKVQDSSVSRNLLP